MDMSEEKRSVGRPSDYDAKFCETVIALGQEGASKAEMAAGCGVTKQTLDNWCEAHPEFFGAVKEAVAFSQAWWEKQGRIATFGGIEGFNATSFIFNMKNRFPDDWREKSEQTVNMNVSHEDALDELG